MEILSRGISNSEGAFSLMQKSRGGIGGKSINQGTRHAMRQKEEDAPCRGGGGARGGKTATQSKKERTDKTYKFSN